MTASLILVFVSRFPSVSFCMTVGGGGVFLFSQMNGSVIKLMTHSKVSQALSSCRFASLERCFTAFIIVYLYCK